MFAIGNEPATSPPRRVIWSFELPYTRWACPQVTSAPPRPVGRSRSPNHDGSHPLVAMRSYRRRPCHQPRAAGWLPLPAQRRLWQFRPMLGQQSIHAEPAASIAAVAGYGQDGEAWGDLAEGDDAGRGFMAPREGRPFSFQPQAAIHTSRRLLYEKGPDKDRRMAGKRKGTSAQKRAGKKVARKSAGRKHASHASEVTNSAPAPRKPRRP
jgi:hypothetical protein